MSELSGCAQCSRILLFILNVLFLISGCALLGLGIFLKVSDKIDIALSDHIDTKILGGATVSGVSIVIIIVAVFTILLSAFGCLGACVKNRVFLYAYATILILMIITEVAALIVLLTTKARIRDGYNSGFRDFFIDSYKNNHTDLQQLIEEMEQEFQCCGADNYTDYQRNNFTLPVSCYKDKNPQSTRYDQGCAQAVVDWIEEKLPAVGGVLGGVLTIELFGVIASIALGVAITHSSKYDY